jgi:predicted DsbA family dithiol-disulfide isomerase
VDYSRRMRIDVVSDTICPWCYIGKRRLERALAGRPGEAFDVHWRPFQLNPTMPPGGMDRRDYLGAKFGDRAGEVLGNVVAVGATENLAFDFDRVARTPNTLNSHRLIRWAEDDGVQNAVVEALFRGYFLEGADIGDPAVLARLAGEAGMDAAEVARRLEAGTDADAVRGEDEGFRRLGVQGVPFFIIERRYAVVGAQDPTAFDQAFDLAARDGLGGAAVN